MEKVMLSKDDLEKVRLISGFPEGHEMDMCETSDAPYYTTFPNPYIGNFLSEYGKPYNSANDTYHVGPFASDVSEGKSDALYNVHSYHTKVPYKAIMKYILHYTNPEDIVLDGFCGTGMTGVAAKQCGNLSEIEKMMLQAELGEVEFGKRKAILSDLSPAATHIAHRYNVGFNVKELEEERERLISKIKDECGWMYSTNDDRPDFGMINYTVWSDVLICPNCGNEFVYWNKAVDRESKKMNDEFHCDRCQAIISKKTCEVARDISFDFESGKTASIPKQVPVLMVYTKNSGERAEKVPDQEDLQKIERIKDLKLPYWVPTDELPKGYNTKQAINAGIKTVDAFFTKRNLYALSVIWNYASSQMKFAITAFILRASKMNKVHVHNFLFGGGGWNAGYLTGVLYFPSLSVETSVIELFNDRVNSLIRAFADIPYDEENAIITTQSATDLANITANSIDYIFTDPPFGGNLNYSELSFVWEAWLKIKTNNKTEAIMNPIQGKGLFEYQDLMTRSFSEYFRVLKPNRWMTVEFHNSKNAVWNAIQEALLRAGFVVADVRTLDKKQGSFKQVTTTTAVKQDLVISVYKPKQDLEERIIGKAGSSETVWEFINSHLEMLPVIVKRDNKIEIVTERQGFLLFDRMVAYHITHGITVPIDASDFYKELEERYISRDGMYFLADQINEYDSERIRSEVEPIQFSFIVSNEKTAISWLYQQLSEEFGGAKTYAELQPKFMQEVKSIDKFEDMPELQVLLEENFLQNDNGKWYVPDVTKEGDVAKLREKKLIKEFEGYLQGKGKLKLFRSEAIRIGFSKLWKDKNYQTIVDLAERLPESTIQEDQNLLMYYDISLSRI